MCDCFLCPEQHAEPLSRRQRQPATARQGANKSTARAMMADRCWHQPQLGGGARQKLPIGMQTFDKLHESGYDLLRAEAEVLGVLPKWAKRSCARTQRRWTRRE